MSEEKIKTLLNDENYMRRLISLGSAEAISKELEKEDVEFSPEEVKQIYSLCKKKAAGELSDSELETISGGNPAIGLAIGFGYLIINTIVAVCLNNC